MWLLLLVVAVPLGWLGWRAFKVSMSRWRVVSALVARGLLLAAVASALAGVSSVRETDRLSVVAVVDVSASVSQYAAAFSREGSAGFAEISQDDDEAVSGDGGGVLGDGENDGAAELPVRSAASRVAGEGLRRSMAEFVRAAETGRGADDLFGVVLFDDEAFAALAPTARRDPETAIEFTGGDGTDIARALRYAELISPAGSAKRLVLIGDGSATSGDALAAARELAAAGIAVDVVPLSYRVGGEVLVEAIDVPPRAAGGSTVAVRAVLRATEAARGTVRVLYNGREIDANGVAPGRGVFAELDAGRNVVTVDVPLREEQVFHRMEVVFEPEGGGDAVATNNRAETFTVTRGRGSVLLVDGRNGAVAGEAGALERALVEIGARVERVSGEGVPADLLGLQGYDLVVLQDVPAWDISPSAQEALVDHVTVMGGGLVMVGGPDGFGAGGWIASELEPVLPVDLEVPDEIMVSEAAVAIVLDSSGSMRQPVLGGSRTQQAIANAGAAQAVRSLDRRDQLMVVSFNLSPRIVVPMGPNDQPERNAALVESIVSGGGTRMFPAMQIAGDALLNVEAGVKHMILLTDGRSDEGNVEMARLANRLNDAGVTVTAIGVGDGADLETLQLIAQNGGGAFYRVDDPRLLPSIFVKEVSVVRRPLIREGEFVPVVRDASSPLILGVDGFGIGDDVPPLGGVVLTTPKGDPKITDALMDPEGAPLLSHWFVGRGQVAAFTSDAEAGGWARAWVGSSSWPGFRALWGQIGRVIARPPLETNAELNATIEGDELVVRYDALDESGEPIDGLSVTGTVTGPDGEPRDVSLTQVAPGRYETRVGASERGNYVVALAPAGGGDGAGRSGLVVGGATKATSAEQRRLRSDVETMRRIAEITGGRVLDLSRESAGLVFERSGVEPARASSPLWPLLVWLALGVFVLDVGTRRVAWDRLISRELMDEVSRHAGSEVRSRAASAARTAGGLRQRFGTRERSQEAPSAASVRAAADSASKPARAAREDADDREAAERAAKIRERQAQRKEELRKKALADLGGGGAQATSPRSEPSKPTKPSGGERSGEDGGKEGSSGTSGLLAAKRRAAERRRGRDLDEG